MSTTENRPTWFSVFVWAIAATSGIAVVALVGLALVQLRTVLVEILISLFFAISLDPPVRWMVRRGIRRGLAVSVIFVGALAVAVPLAWSGIAPVTRQVRAFATGLPEYLARLRSQSPAFRDLDSRFRLETHLDSWLATLPSHTDDAVAFGQRFLGALSTGGLVAVLTIYLMLALPRLRERLIGMSPSAHREAMDRTIGIVADKVGAYMLGNLVISGIAGVSSFAVLEFLGVPFAVVLALIMAVGDLIPMVGATIGAAVCVLVALATTQIWPQAVVLLIFFVLYQQVENYLIAPRVLRGSVEMPALAVLLATLAGGALLGLTGVLMAIPVAAAMRAVYVEIFRSSFAGGAPEGERLGEGGLDRPDDHRPGVR